MTLSELASAGGFEIPPSAADETITAITDDSREAGPGVLFFATPEAGQYADDAEKKGARVVRKGRGEFSCDSPEKSMGLASAHFYGHPSRSLVLAGITGTNGKTSTAWMIYHLWKEQGIQAGMIGTLGVRYTAKEGEVQSKTGYTTPRSWQLQKLLAEMKEAGVVRVVMEVSSEALALERPRGCAYHTAVFTNITRDHLDHHGTMEAYFQAKKSLLDLTAENRGRLVLFYTEEEWSKKMCSHALDLAGQCEVHIVRQAEDLGLTARFQNANASLAVIAASVTPEEEARARRMVSHLPDVPGRFEKIDIAEGAQPGSAAVVDYAHSPDALEAVLLEARHAAGQGGRVICVFGCGGNRDPGKRPMMGRIASTLSDIAIVTDDNPRREDPAAIRKEILAGVPETPRGRVLETGDRRAAIEQAVRLGRESGGIVVIAGKGHETGQIFQDRTEPFSDREEILLALKRIVTEAGS